MLARLGKRAWLHCDGPPLSPASSLAPSAQHADAAVHDLGDALHALRGEEGVLLARAAQYAGD